MNEPVTEVIEGGIIRVMEDGIPVDPVKEEVVGKNANEEGGVPLTSQCSVCTAPAAEHRHYGAVSCYSCRWQKNRILICVTKNHLALS